MIVSNTKYQHIISNGMSDMLDAVSIMNAIWNNPGIKDNSKNFVIVSIISNYKFVYFRLF